MNSVIKKLSDIEATAEAIVEHAESQKSEIERRIQEERDQFDQDLETETEKKLDAIKAEAEKEMKRILEHQIQKNQSTIDDLKKEYEKNHDVYAQEILEHILEV